MLGKWIKVVCNSRVAFRKGQGAETLPQLLSSAVYLFLVTVLV